MARRQEVLNVVLAELLRDQGVVAAPEEIISIATSTRRMPDVLVDFSGLRVAIEGEFDAADARRKAIKSALGRVEEGLAHMGIAVVYETRLRDCDFGTLRSELAASELEFAVVTESDTSGMQTLFEDEGIEVAFHSGTVTVLVAALHRAYSQLVQDDVLQQAVERLGTAIDDFSQGLLPQPATVERFAARLEGSSSGVVPDVPLPTAEKRLAVCKVAGLVVANALIFQEILSQKDSRVIPIARVRTSDDLLARLSDHWEFILSEINYYAIFHIAQELLVSVASDRSASRAIQKLLQAASEIVKWRAPLRHDLAGRLFHLLLQEAKYLGAYYTSIPTATLLLKLAFSEASWIEDWSDISQVSSLRIGDLACGTGTLLAAAAEAVTDNYVRACAATGRPPDTRELYRVLLEEVIVGCDVLPSAVHLTASTLALREPDAPVHATNLRCLPLGGPDRKLGSLELLLTYNVPESYMFTESERLGGDEGGEAAAEYAHIPSLHLCVMNPPFTRSVGGNLLFGNMPRDERRAMQTRLRGIVASQRVPASITAGLGSVFVALAHRHVAIGGRLAFVLPRAVLSGVSWQRTRELLESKYALEYIVVSHEPDHWNFSENTELSEALIIAKRHGESSTGADIDASSVCFVNLWRQPTNAVEALTFAREIQQTRSPESESSVPISAAELIVSERKTGECLWIKQGDLAGNLWSLPCAFAQSELTFLLYSLLKGAFCLGNGSDHTELSLTRLDSIASVGFDRRDIHDGFTVSDRRTQYPAYWGHDADATRTLEQEPNRFLRPRRVAAKERNLRNPRTLWESRSRLLVPERLWLHTTRLAAIRLSEEVLSNVWWTISLREPDTQAEKALSLL